MLCWKNDVGGCWWIGGIWFKVLAARYGEESERFKLGGRDGSSWWREVERVQDGMGVACDRWFDDNVWRKVSNGTNTFFWTDYCAGSAPLCERYMRLFEKSVFKELLVADMFSLGWGEGGEAWK